MSNTGNSIKWEDIREIAAGSLTTSYQVFGGIFTRDSFRFVFTNHTNGDIYISTNGTTNKIKMPAGTSRIYDNKTNDMYLKTGEQFYVRWDVEPESPTGWVGLEVEYV